MNKLLLLSIFIIIFSSLATSNAFFFEESTEDKIFIQTFDSWWGHISYDGIEDNYMYTVSFIVGNASSSLEGNSIVTYFYNNSSILLSNEDSHFSNNTTHLIEKDNFYEDGNSFYEQASLESNESITITHVNILILDEEDNVIFNTTQPFNMTDFTDYDLIDFSSYESDENTDEEIFIGNKNSLIFHEQFCHLVDKMNEENKVIFNSYDEAKNAGYEPCGQCQA